MKKCEDLQGMQNNAQNDRTDAEEWSLHRHSGLNEFSDGVLSRGASDAKQKTR